MLTEAWYTTMTKHSPFKGHLFGSLQLQDLLVVLSSGGVFCLRIVLLCPCDVDLSLVRHDLKGDCTKPFPQTH